MVPAMHGWVHLRGWPLRPWDPHSESGTLFFFFNLNTYHLFNTNLRKWGAGRTEIQSVASRRWNSHISEKKAQPVDRRHMNSSRDSKFNIFTHHQTTGEVKDWQQWRHKQWQCFVEFPLQRRLSKSARVTFCVYASGSWCRITAATDQQLMLADWRSEDGSTLTFGVNQVTDKLKSD